MCCCREPHVNGTPGAYSWDGKHFMTATPIPPKLGEHDTLLFDEPGRCGNGVGDSHSHELRLVKQQYGGYALLVRHGGGEERISLGHSNQFANMAAAMDSNARYAFLIRFYHIQSDLVRAAVEAEGAKWRTAIIEKRIKKKRRKQGGYPQITIEPRHV